MSCGGDNATGEVNVLGPWVVTTSGSAGSLETIELSAIQRRILMLLAASQPAPVPRNALIEAIWEGSAPKTAEAALNNQMSRIRQACGASIIVTTDRGYVLGWPTDLERAVDSLSAAEDALAAGDHVAARQLADMALAAFRGRPPTDFEAHRELAAIGRRAVTLHRTAEMLRLRIAVDSGRLSWAAVEAERLVAMHPADEQCWSLLAEIHERAGRRGEALGVIDRARRTLRDTLGLDPGPSLDAVLVSILGHPGDRDGRPPTRAFGRGTELDAIQAALTPGAFVVIRGETGSGRTTVLAKSAQRIRRAGGLVGSARCVPNPATPLGDLAEILDDLNVGAEPTFGLLNGFVRALEGIDAASVVLVVDDLENAGPSTVAALRAAAESRAVAVVASANDAADWVWRDSDCIIDLAPLDATAVGLMATSILDRVVTSATAQWLTQLCGGNPSLLEQLLHDTAVRDAVTTDLAGDVSGDDPLTLIDSHEFSGLADLVRRRVERLGGRTRLALEIAAVCGPSMPTTLIEQLVPSADGLAAAQAVGLLERSGNVTAFRHAAVQRVVYNDLAPGRRMEFHHLVGNALADDGDASASVVAHHLLAAAPLDANAAVDAARRAAHEATQQGAHLEAAGWLERAEGCVRTIGPGDSRLRVELLIARGDALRLAGEQAHVDLLFEAADLAIGRNDPDLLADAAFALLQLGSTAETGRLEIRAAELADLAMDAATDPERWALVAAAASLTHSMSGHPQRCRELFLEAEQAAVSADVRGRVLPFAYLALGHPADAAVRRRIADELLTLGQRSGDPATLFEAHHLGFSVALQTADGPRARGALAAMEAIVATVGDVGRRWALLYCSAALAHIEDRLDECEQLSTAAMTVFMPVAPSRAFATYGAQMIAVRHAQGRIAELTEVFESLVADQPGVPAWHAALALALAQDQPGRAIDHARRALDDVPPDFTWLAGHVIGGRAAAITGDRSTVATYRERLAPWSGMTCWQGTCTYGPVDTTLALLAAAAGDHAAAKEHRERAFSIATRLGGAVFIRELCADEAG